jgi:hypothetical protein
VSVSRASLPKASSVNITTPEVSQVSGAASFRGEPHRVQY